jgi:hypothetical protein
MVAGSRRAVMPSHPADRVALFATPRGCCRRPPARDRRELGQRQLCARAAGEQPRRVGLRDRTPTARSIRCAPGQVRSSPHGGSARRRSRGAVQGAHRLRRQAQARASPWPRVRRRGRHARRTTARRDPRAHRRSTVTRRDGARQWGSAGTSHRLLRPVLSTRARSVSCSLRLTRLPLRRCARASSGSAPGRPRRIMAYALAAVRHQPTSA